MEPQSLIVTAYQKNHTYDDRYVDQLSRAVAANSERELIVLREDRWPGWWCKMGIFDPDLIGDHDILYLDLDTVVIGHLKRYMQQGRDTVLRDFYFPERMASGFMYLTAETRLKVWDIWRSYSAEIMIRYKGVAGGGDGRFLNGVIGDSVAFWQDEFPGEIVSFKVDCQDDAPSNARVVCYHGSPRPHETGWASCGRGRWPKRVPPSALRAP